LVGGVSGGKTMADKQEHLHHKRDEDEEPAVMGLQIFT